MVSFCCSSCSFWHSRDGHQLARDGDPDDDLVLQDRNGAAHVHRYHAAITRGGLPGFGGALAAIGWRIFEDRYQVRGDVSEILDDGFAQAFGHSFRQLRLAVERETAKHQAVRGDLYLLRFRQKVGQFFSQAGERVYGVRIVYLVGNGADRPVRLYAVKYGGDSGAVANLDISWFDDILRHGRGCLFVGFGDFLSRILDHFGRHGNRQFPACAPPPRTVESILEA